MKRQKLGIKILLVVLGASLLLTPFAGCAAEEEGKGTITLAYAEYDTVQIGNQICIFILKHGYGYEGADSIPVGTTSSYLALERGDLDIDMEMWIDSAPELYQEYVVDGPCIDLGTQYSDNWQGWLVPTYMIEGDPERGIEATAPDLESVFDLANYWELFQDPEEPTKGRFHNYAPGSSSTDSNARKLEGYGLLEYFNDYIAGSGAALGASMVAAYEKGEAWLGYWWEPTWQLGLLDMTKLEESPYDKEIFDTTRLCAYPACRVDIICTHDFPDRCPDAAEFFGNYKMPCTRMSELLCYMQDTGADVEEAAMYFLREYESVWRTWVPSDVYDKVKAALEALD